MEPHLSKIVSELMNEDSIGWSMKEWLRCVSIRLEEQDMEIPEDESFKSILKQIIMIQAAQLAPTQEESMVMETSSLQIGSMEETDLETAPQYEDLHDDAEAVLNRMKTKKSKKTKGKSVKRSRGVQKKVQKEPRDGLSPAPQVKDDTSDHEGNSPARTDSDASDSDLDSGDEVLDVRNIISGKGRSLRKEHQQQTKPEMTYAEAVAAAQQKIISEEVQAVQIAERELTEAELHRKALIEMDEDEREEMAERLRTLALQGIRKQVLPMLQRARRQVEEIP